jgi:chaperonin cofactor prefoldin
MGYADILETLPNDLQIPMLRFAEAIESTMREQLAVRREDFDELRSDIRELAAAQQRTEERLEQLILRVDSLAAAQQRTEERMDALANASIRSSVRC